MDRAEYKVPCRSSRNAIERNDKLAPIEKEPPVKGEELGGDQKQLAPVGQCTEADNDDVYSHLSERNSNLKGGNLRDWIHLTHTVALLREIYRPYFGSGEALRIESIFTWRGIEVPLSWSGRLPP